MHRCARPSNFSADKKPEQEEIRLRRAPAWQAEKTEVRNRGGIVPGRDLVSRDRVGGETGDVARRAEKAWMKRSRLSKTKVR